MTAATATSGAPVLYRSRRRIAIWALALTLSGAAAGTVTTLAVTNDDSPAKAVPAAVVPSAVVSSPQNLPRTADAAEQWVTPGFVFSNADDPTNSDAPDQFKSGPQ
jgi:hypothetical protein